MPSLIYARFVPLIGSLLLILPGCGSDGSTGPRGPSGTETVDASTASDATLAALDVVSEITKVTIQSPPVITFTVKTSKGVPIVGLVPFWNDSSRFIRFTMTKLVPGQNGDPDRWVAYTRDATSGDPDYDTGASLVDNKDGSYTFTFNTDVTNVSGVTWEPTLTHRVAGQIGSYRTVPLEEQNLWLDFVPNGAAVTTKKSVSVMTSCNECHTHLVFHGRRFQAEYCVQCHNSDLAQGEGDYAFMIHRIHNSGKFAVLDGAKDYSHVTYPQDVTNCRKCHNVDDATTPEADNWRTRPNMTACDGCHDVFNTNAKGVHTGGAQVNNARCVVCHSADAISTDHATPFSTPNNPEIPQGQHLIKYELVSVAVDSGTNNVTIKFKITSDGTALDMANLPAEFKDGSSVPFRFPSFLLAYTQPQHGVAEPADYNNLGRTGGQPIGASIGDLSPIKASGSIGTISFNSADGVNTAVITSSGSQFPTGSKMRAVALQGYLRQDLDNDGSYDVSLHTTSATAAVTGDKKRREIIDTTKCSQCHEFFAGHGGNRVFNAESSFVCVFCHVPNLSSSGRTLSLSHEEDSQNMRDMIHGIHASAIRNRDYKHVRNFRAAARVYDWSHVTFPRGSSTKDCMLCHKEGTYQMPLPTGQLPVTVRTTSAANGQDATTTAANTARGTLPNATDWVNTPLGSSCFYCHTSLDAWAHMQANGSQLSNPILSTAKYVNRSAANNTESCIICHGEGRISDINVVHKRD